VLCFLCAHAVFVNMGLWFSLGSFCGVLLLCLLPLKFKNNGGAVFLLPLPSCPAVLSTELEKEVVAVQWRLLEEDDI